MLALRSPLAVRRRRRSATPRRCSIDQRLVGTAGLGLTPCLSNISTCWKFPDATALHNAIEPLPECLSFMLFSDRDPNLSLKSWQRWEESSPIGAVALEPRVERWSPRPPSMHASHVDIGVLHVGARHQLAGRRETLRSFRRAIEDAVHHDVQAGREAFVLGGAFNGDQGLPFHGAHSASYRRGAYAPARISSSMSSGRDEPPLRVVHHAARIILVPGSLAVRLGGSKCRVVRLVASDDKHAHPDELRVGGFVLPGHVRCVATTVRPDFGGREHQAAKNEECDVNPGAWCPGSVGIAHGHTLTGDRERSVRGRCVVREYEFVMVPASGQAGPPGCRQTAARWRVTGRPSHAGTGSREPSRPGQDHRCQATLAREA